MTITAAELADRENWLSTGDVRRVLGVSNQAVHKMVKAGRLPFVDTPAGRLYPREAVNRLKDERAHTSQPVEQAL